MSEEANECIPSTCCNLISSDGRDIEPGDEGCFGKSNFILEYEFIDPIGRLG